MSIRNTARAATARTGLNQAFRWVLPLLLGAALFASPLRPARAAPPVGESAPTYSVHTINGRVIDSAASYGKVVLLHFWATWCKPCREELPALDAYYKAHRQDGFELVAINIEDKEAVAKVKSFTKNYSFPVAMIDQAQVDDYGRIAFLPLSYLIDRHGVIRKSAWNGSEKITAASLDKLVGGLLAPSTQRVSAQ